MVRSKQGKQMDTQVPATPMGTQVDDAMMVEPPTTVQGISRGIRFASDIVASVGDSPSLGATLLSDELETDQSLISDLSSDNAGGVPSSRKSPCTYYSSDRVRWLSAAAALLLLKHQL